MIVSSVFLGGAHDSLFDECLMNAWTCFSREGKMLLDSKYQKNIMIGMVTIVGLRAALILGETMHYALELFQSWDICQSSNIAE